MRQWVLSVPYAIRFLFAAHPGVMGKVLGIVNRAIETHLIHKAGLTRSKASTGAVTLQSWVPELEPGFDTKTFPQKLPPTISVGGYLRPAGEIAFGGGSWDIENPQNIEPALLAAVEQLYLEGLMTTRDAVEGLYAFIEKREPNWNHGVGPGSRDHGHRSRQAVPEKG